MGSLKTTPAGNRGSNSIGQCEIQQANATSNSAWSQRKKILNWLQLSSLTTFQARKELDIMHPAARVQELREQGHSIFTHWEIIDTGKVKHRVAKYLLLASGVKPRAENNGNVKDV